MWYHVAVAYNNHDYKMYVNGVLESELSNVSITQSSGPINIGRRNSSHNYDWDPFKGLVDEGGLYNRQLSADEILSIYSAGPDGKCKPVSYVSSITPSYTPSGDQYQVSAAVTVYDAHGIPVTHATVAVDVTLPDGSVMQGTLTTKGNGSGTYSLLSSQTGTYTFTVTNVTALTRSYDPSLNVESSDSITVP